MGFLKKLSKSDYNEAYRQGGYREREALKNQYARTPVNVNGKKGVKIHYWKEDYQGKKERANATWVKGRGWF